MMLGAQESKPLEWTGWLLLVTAIVTFGTQAWWILAGNPKPGWFSDSVDYLILADFFQSSIAGPGTTTNLSSNVFATSRFPPLLPLTLALAGGGTRSWTVGYWVCLGHGLLSILTTFLWLRQQTGRKFAAASLLPIAILSPQYFALHLGIYSESQFILLMTLVFWLALRCQQGRISPIAFALIAGLLPLSRTAGMSVLLGLSIWFVFRNLSLPLKSRLLSVGLMWLPAGAWHFYRERLPIESAYSDYLIGTLGDAPDLWSSMFVAEKLGSVLAGFTSWFDLVGDQRMQVVVFFILSASLIGWFIRVIRWEIDAIVLPIYLGLVFVWPFPAETARLLAVSMPVIALSLWECLNFASQRSSGASALFNRIGPSVVVLCVCAVAAGPTWLDIVRRAKLPVDPELEANRRMTAYFTATPLERAPLIAEIMARFESLVAEIPRHISRSDCVWTTFMTATAYFSNFGLIPALLPADLGDSDTARVKLAACRYVVVVSMVSPQKSYPPLYPMKTIESISSPVLVSYVNVDGSQKIAAALLDLRTGN